MLDDVLAKDGKLISIKGEEVKKISLKKLLAFCRKHNIYGYKGKNQETVCALIHKKEETSNVIQSRYNHGTDASVAKNAVAGTCASVAKTAVAVIDDAGTAAVGTATVRSEADFRNHIDGNRDSASAKRHLRVRASLLPHQRSQRELLLQDP